MFVLHPKDERVIRRRSLNTENGIIEKEDYASQFKHGVKCNIQKNINRKLSISVCFRQVNTYRQYSRQNNTMIERKHDIDEAGDNENGIPCLTIAAQRRHKIISEKRNEIKSEGNVRRIRKRNRQFYEDSKQKMKIEKMKKDRRFYNVIEEYKEK